MAGYLSPRNADGKHYYKQYLYMSSNSCNSTASVACIMQEIIAKHSFDVLVSRKHEYCENNSRRA